MYHTPVLLEKSVEGLCVKPDGLYADVTFGGGGHSRQILDSIQSGHLFAFDQDADAAKNAFDDDRFTFIPQNFRFFKNFIQLHTSEKLDGILADLGVSSYQFDTPERGFSTRFDGKLDMRMDQLNPIDATIVINTYTHAALTKIFSVYGEVQNAHLVAADIIQARNSQVVETTRALKEAVKRHTPKGKENKVLAQIFQALRIEVNQEMAVLEQFLGQCADMLKPGGRLVVISYHSLEDRLVKNFMKTGNALGRLEKDFFGNSMSPYKLVTRKPIVPTETEIEQNSRARSARLRIAERI
ncbi:MAG: 16S rRNA (cytosine(1402)-N(4))-methyltransferase RsmH [Lentimicrobiaceae bacterium]|jgi:16S rRNA (cytosine1402-N4)-methyltransferase|nr:16S rRNA (cytosine(1402)-N(4))-methyltransferase RsmH [Lentimicrobiaceae bacterium]